MTKPEAPVGWEVLGQFPDIDADTADAAELDLLCEDLYQARRDDSVVDAGWYPEGARDGFFVCRLIESGDWETPVEEFRTRNMVEALEWTEETIRQADLRFGEPGSTTSEANSVLVPEFPPTLSSAPSELLPMNVASDVSRVRAAS